MAKPIVDKDVINIIQAHEDKTAKYISLFVFFKSFAHSAAFVDKLTPVSGIFVKRLNFMPVVIVTFLKHQSVLPLLLRDPYVKHIALNNPAGEKIELQSEATKPKVPFRYPGIDLWWNHGFKGQSGIIGLIDSGIAPDHPSLSGKKIIINKRLNSYYSKYPYGVRSPHGTGVACIYAGYPQDKQKRIRGVAYKTATILSTLAGEGNHHKEDYYLTYSSLNWLLSGFSGKPSIINYSFGNGDVTCPFCSDWSGMAKIVDYIVNQEKILWVTSAGNNGFIKPRTHYPFASTMTVPAESYNALTVANMNMYAEEEYTVARKYMRATHAIRYTSSRGPTLIGRKKP
ncbi:MAG: S8 family serine peptidase, partial [bacterium]|nr:S8 family serine peptidase [bacterium]